MRQNNTLQKLFPRVGKVDSTRCLGFQHALESLELALAVVLAKRNDFYNLLTFR